MAAGAVLRGGWGGEKRHIGGGGGEHPFFFWCPPFFSGFGCECEGMREKGGHQPSSSSSFLSLYPSLPLLLQPLTFTADWFLPRRTFPSSVS